MKDKNNDSGFVKICAVLGGIFLVITAVFVIFARESLELLVPIVWALVVLGIVIGFFQYKALKSK